MKQVYAYSEAELVKGCREKKSLYQRAFYERYYRKMFGICLRYAKNTDNAEDVLQDGFIKVFTHIDSFRGKGSLEGWVRQIMVRTAIEHYRRNSKYQMVDVENASGIELQADQLSLLAKEEILAMIQELPIGYRTIFNLYVIEGYPHKEIASMLKISIGTSKSQLSRAKAILKEQMEKRGVRGQGAGVEGQR